MAYNPVLIPVVGIHVEVLEVIKPKCGSARKVFAAMDSCRRINVLVAFSGVTIRFKAPVELSHPAGHSVVIEGSSREACFNRSEDGKWNLIFKEACIDVDDLAVGQVVEIIALPTKPGQVKNLIIKH
jgi:hypothetical protein